MKDLNTYLESGILELYVLGDLSSEEIREVENTIAQHPEVKAELEAIENALQAYAIFNAIQPSEAVRKKILSSGGAFAQNRQCIEFLQVCICSFSRFAAGKCYSPHKFE